MSCFSCFTCRLTCRCCCRCNDMSYSDGVYNPKEGIEGTDSASNQPAVCVRAAYKFYGKKKCPLHVLINFNMTVTKGTIYGLLGASGCGKTTLLSCIIGRRRLNSGDIWVLGGKPGTKESGVPGKRVGYMPQELALYGDFTIKETMMYFGWIYGMKTQEINERLNFLLSLLDLPSPKRLVKNLSGGQQRRVSFCVALIHDPELLILDEPTVGVDPLLRQSIWNHLVRLTKDGNKTIIITTHYIEEARQAHFIGLMRSGKLLAENPPLMLMSMYNCNSLEDVFLKLSQTQDASSKGDNLYSDLNSPPPTCNPKKSEEYRDCFSSCSLTTSGKMRALLQKHSLRMWRNVGMMLFIFALPVMQVILFCLAIGKDPTGLKLAIVNQEVPYYNRTYQSCPFQESCSVFNLSCRYLRNLRSTRIIKEFYPDTDTAINEIKVGNVWGAMYFSEYFTSALQSRILSKGTFVNEELINRGTIHVWLDMSNMQIGVVLQRDLHLAFQEFVHELLEDCNMNSKQADLPIYFEKPIYGKNETSFTDFVAPGMIVTIVFFSAVALTASVLIVERAEGLLDRSRVAGVTSFEILLSHIISQFIVMSFQAALVLIFMILVFGVTCNGPVHWIIALTLVQGLCGMCFGFMISAICDEERDAIQLALGSFYPTMMLSGVIWPIEGMPIILQYVAVCLPLTRAIGALRSLMTRGWSIIAREVYLGFATTAVWIVVYLSLSLLIQKVKRG